MKKIMLAMRVVTLSGCAANSGIIAMGQDIYFVLRQAATGFTGMGTLKAEAIGGTITTEERIADQRQ
ncbi:MAG: hypothetical protein ACOH2K_10045 [Burkholderiaceae bacterium]